MSIRKMRRAAGLTQEEFAKQIGSAQPTVACWEKGHNMPRASKLIEMSKVLCCSVDDLLKKDEVQQ